MKLKYHVFLDRRQIMFAELTALFVCGAAVILADPEEGWFWLVPALLAMLCGTLTLLTPCLYIMSDEGIAIYYLLGFLRRFTPWSTVCYLEVRYPKGTKNFPYVGDTFAIHGKTQGKSFFFTENEIVRTRRARKLLERYTGMKVEGFMIDDLRAWGKKRKEKRERMRRHREKQAQEARNREAKKAANKAAKKSPSRPTKK